MKKITLICLLTATILSSFAAQAHGQRRKQDEPVSDEEVRQAVKKMIGFIWSKQNNRSGLWPAYIGGQNRNRGGRVRISEEAGHNTHPWGPASLAAYALLSTGKDHKTGEYYVNFQDKRMQKALGALAEPDSIMTYTLGLRANVWLYAYRRAPLSEKNTFRRLLFRDASKLVYSTKTGNYSYKSYGREEGQKNRRGGDNSNAQYGLLGVWAAELAQAGAEIPDQYWRVVMNHWLLTQRPDGGWNYRPGDESNSRGTMTAAGVASLFVCLDNSFEEAFISCNAPPHDQAIQRGLDWFDRNFSSGGGGGRIDGYYLYGVERVGLASGYKYFGETDWYQAGARAIINSMKADGSVPGGSHGGSHADGLVNTCFALLFLIRGQHPVMFNKLNFDGDWNNRPRDLANLTRWRQTRYEDVLNWQIINLQVPVEEWHDAPIVYLSGFKKPNFTDEQIQKLRRYVLQGGTIFSCSECGGTAGFKEGIRQVYQRMFPEYELTTATKDHEIYNTPGKLPGQTDFHIMTNGVRPLVIHTDTDLPLAWQTKRTGTAKFAFDAANNVFVYVTNNELRSRGSWSWPEEPKETPEKKIQVVRVEYGGNWNPEPLALERLRRLLAQHEKIDMQILDPVGLADLGSSDAKIAFLTGTGQTEFTAAQAEALKKFIDKGGTVLVDAAGGRTEFYRAAQNLIRKANFQAPPQMINRTDDLLNLPDHKIAEELSLRGESGTEPLSTIRKVPIFTDQGSRLGVLISRADITGGLVGYAASTVKGFKPGTDLEEDSPYLLVRNLILSVLKN